MIRYCGIGIGFARKYIVEGQISGRVNVSVEKMVSNAVFAASQHDFGRLAHTRMMARRDNGEGAI